MSHSEDSSSAFCPPATPFSPIDFSETPLKRPYSLVGQIVGLHNPTDERPKKRRRKKAVSLPLLASTFARTRGTALVDRYYAQRYLQAVEIDPRLVWLINVLGIDAFGHKTVLEQSCGCGLVCFYLAAYLGAARVVGRQNDTQTLFDNLKQLRKFKHDGIRTANSLAGDYPQILVKRSGPARVTNKPWKVLDKHVHAGAQLFPFNLEFQKTDLPSEEQFDLVLGWNQSVADLLQFVIKPGGIIVAKFDPGKSSERFGKFAIYRI